MKRLYLETYKEFKISKSDNIYILVLFDLNNQLLYNYNTKWWSFNDTSKTKIKDYMTSFDILEKFKTLNVYLENSLEINQNIFENILNTELFLFNKMNKKKFYYKFNLIEYLI